MFSLLLIRAVRPMKVHKVHHSAANYLQHHNLFMIYLIFISVGFKPGSSTSCIMAKLTLVHLAMIHDTVNSAINGNQSYINIVRRRLPAVVTLLTQLPDCVGNINKYDNTFEYFQY